ncbi:MAG: 50S ribosomal protein L29 [Flavobacteriales bacterium]|jgi:large subunit ribosomal protein L29|nr:50S ribosomal protein L29 [Flavobacteriales bacterium]|tara:strand:+ start:124 stop:321 length:198 start_codon:yes stop_codon:yes gene_type:complete
MKASVITEMTTDEIKDKLSEEVEMVSKLKLSHAVSPLENPMQLKDRRQDVARLKTELNKRELESK